MLIGAIDIGTNTVLMLIADVRSDGSLHIVRDEHFIGRLGKGVDEHGIISTDTFHRIHGILSQLKTIANSQGVTHVSACGTSALRDAVNRQEFIDFIKEKLGFEIRILSGAEEAELTYLGAISDYSPNAQPAKYAVLDIGGGSTEMIVGSGTQILLSNSMDIGSVRLTERILKNNPPAEDALENAIRLVQDHLHPLLPLSPEASLIGVAGTLTTLAALDLSIPKFDKDLVHHHLLTKESIEEIFQELRPLTLDQLRSYPQIHPARADILLAGIIILREIVSKVNALKITVSDRGLRYGIALQTASGLLTKSY